MGIWTSGLLWAAGSVAGQDLEQRYQYVAGLAERGLHEQVAKEASALLAEHPGHGRAPFTRYRLAEALFALRRFDAARLEFERLDALRDFDFAVEVDFRRGLCARELGDLDGAEGPWGEVVAAGEGYLRWPALALLGDANLRTGELDAATAAFERLLGAEGAADHGSDALHGLVWCQFRREQGDALAERAGQFLARFPGDPRRAEVWFVLGESELARGRAQSALEAYGQVTAGPHAPAALRGTAFAHSALGQPALAAAAHGRLLELFGDGPLAPEAALHCAVEHLRAGEPALALAGLDDPRVPGGPGTQAWRARCLLALGRADEACAAAELGLRANPPEELRASLEWLIGDGLREQGRASDAAAAYERGGGEYGWGAAAAQYLAAGRPADTLRLGRQLADFPAAAAARQGRLWIAEAQFALGDHRAASDSFADLLPGATEPTEATRLRLRLTWSQFLDGDWAAARTAAAEVLAGGASGDEEAQALYLAGRAAEEAGDGSAAAAPFERYLQRFPAGPWATEVAVRLAAQRPGPEGEAWLERAARTPDEFGRRAQFDLAERLAARGETARAAATYGALLASAAGPLAAPAEFGLAWCELELGRAEDCRARLLRLLEFEGLDPELERSTLELSVFAARAAGDADLARAAFEGWAARGPQQERLLAAAQAAAAALVAADRRPEAQKLMRGAAAQATEPELRAALGLEQAWLELDQGQRDAARQTLEQVRVLAPQDPGLAEASFFLAQAYFEAGDDDAAAALYALALPLAAPEWRAELHYGYGFAELRRGADAAAAEQFAALLAVAPGHVLAGETQFLLGEALARAGRTAEAMAALETQLAAHPRHAVRAKALFRLGGLALAAGQPQRAAEVLAELVRDQPQFEARIEAECLRGTALAQLGQGRAARACFERVLEWDGAGGLPSPFTARARLALGRLSRDEGDLDGALSEFLKVAVLAADPEAVAEALWWSSEVLAEQGHAAQARARLEEAAARHPATVYGARAAEELAAPTR
jgi:tetratricopeptide (TPR) repeat protein